MLDYNEMVNRTVQFQNLGLIEYRKAWDYQEELFEKIVEVKQQNRREKTEIPTPNYLLFCEHQHVYTLGKSGKESNLLIDERFLESKGANLVRINRGGDITYHGPGQIVGYPILDLDNFGLSIKSYIHHLEEVIISSLRQLGIESSRMKGATGVWLDADDAINARKICAIGVRTSHWVSMHGFALNINTDLSYFDHIVPCGIQNKGVTSIMKELGAETDIMKVQSVLIDAFQKEFEMHLG